MTISDYTKYFELCGGVNLPKVITCRCSDGKRRRQLLKGKDDLRQDAVMQQVFDLINHLLKKDKSTLKQRLCMRTYKVSRTQIVMYVVVVCDITGGSPVSVLWYSGMV